MNGLNKDVRAMKGMERRDLTTSTGTGAVENEWLENTWVEYLYNIMLSPKLGIEIMSGVDHNVVLPRQTGATTVSTVAENSAASGSNPTLDNIVFQPRSAIGVCNISRNFILTSSMAAENFVRKDVVSQIGVHVDGKIFNGNPGSNAPDDYGIFYDSSIPSANSTAINTAFAGASYLPTWSNLLAMEAAVKAKNVILDGTEAYVGSPHGEQVLSQTAKQATGQSSTFPMMLLENGKLNGHSFYQSNQIPESFTVSGQSGVFSGLIFGVWSYCVLAQYGAGLELLVDPYTNAASGSVRIVGVLSYDHKLKKGEAFATATNFKVG